MNTAHPDLKYRFLLVAEDSLSSELVDICARQDIQLDHAPNHLRAISAMDDTLYQGLLIAVAGQTISGLELCAMIRARENLRMSNPVYIILLGGPNDLVPILTQGSTADDYIIGAWLDLELEWKIRKAVKILDLLGSGPASQVLTANPNLLNADGLRTFLFEEVNRVGRRNGCMSISVIWLPDMAGLRASYGRDWITWFTSRVWAHIRRQLRNYDRLAVLDGGFLCLISPDLDEVGTGALLDRLNADLKNYQDHAHELADVPLLLSARYLCVCIESDYRTLEPSSETIWQWIQHRIAEPITTGVLGHTGRLCGKLEITPPQMLIPDLLSLTNVPKT